MYWDLIQYLLFMEHILKTVLKFKNEIKIPGHIYCGRGFLYNKNHIRPLFFLICSNSFMINQNSTVSSRWGLLSAASRKVSSTARP